MTNKTESDESFEMSDYYIMLRKNWLIAAIIFIIILGAALAYTFLSPKWYEAESRVMITTQDQTSYLLGQTAIRVDIQTQKEIILSRTIMNNAYLEATAPFKVFVEPIKDSNVITIRVESQNPFTAMRVANKIAESYVNYTRESKVQEALDVKSFILDQITVYQGEMDTLNKQILVYKNSLANLTTDQMLIYENLQQTMAAKEKLYNQLLARAEEVGISAQERSGNVKIIEYASLPIYPVKPNVLLNILLGVVLGIIGGLGVVILKYSIKNTFMNIKDVENELGPYVMGVIPKVRPQDYGEPDSKKGFNLIFDYKPHSAFAEGIRALGTNISLYLKDKEMKFIAVTSPEEGDGKSMVAANLAVELAHDGKKVLLIDTNLRKPQLNKWFLIKKNEPGVGDVVKDKAQINNVIKKTPYKHLYMIPAGSFEFSRELVTHNKIQNLFNKLKNNNADVVIFDAPALKYSESTVISANSQGVLVVIAPHKTNRDLAIKNKDMLAHIKANVIGFVINFFNQ